MWHLTLHMEGIVMKIFGVTTLFKILGLYVIYDALSTQKAVDPNVQFEEIDRFARETGNFRSSTHPYSSDYILFCRA